MNAAQKEYLAASGKASVEDFEPGSIAKLEFANLADILEIKPVETAPEYSQAQVQYLCGQSVDELDSEHLEIFNRLGTPTGGSSTTDGTSAAKLSGTRDFDHAKLNAAYPNSPTQRLTIAYAWDTVLQDRNEAASGIAPELRESRNDISRARELVAPYLA
ncbi:MAG: hypothetical protein E5Y06_10585 [Mesorhizobium sp.]|uniref:hypothetical protein n=1 Tax=Mesorhizobium sp. TaxID=1871066 RepID=UPI00120B38A3|nr:hypothetical protein [Mesorhizobium sp.]TIN95694.1 MAG: hypothetical protein E5Y06_10585 [Mesorhizobium sp.]TJU98487.1 MAG: hypothetical protein E5Y08_13435 [Mesorhizobium sp.]